MATKRKVIDEECYQSSERRKRSKTTPSENGDLSPREKTNQLQKRAQSDPLPEQSKLGPRNFKTVHTNSKILVQSRNRTVSKVGKIRSKPQIRAKARRLSQPIEATDQDFALHYARIPATTLRFWYRVRFHEKAPETRDELVNKLVQDDISRNKNTASHAETHDCGERIEAHIETVPDATFPGKCEQQNNMAGSYKDVKVAHTSTSPSQQQEKREIENPSKANINSNFQIEDLLSDPSRPAQELDSPNLSLDKINGQDSYSNYVLLRNFWLAQQNRRESQDEISMSSGEVRYLEHDQIVRAIATVTEALAAVGHNFALTTSNAIQLATAGSDGIAMNLRAVRPRQTFVFPYTFQYTGKGISTRGCNNHHLLVVVEIDRSLKTRKLPRISLYDSAPKLLLRASMDFRRQLINNISHTIRNLQWFSWPDHINPPHGFLEPIMQVQVPVQASKYSCGINAILNGWAVALGLRIKPDTKLDESFDVQARQLVNLALQGYLDTRTILSFLKYHRYVEADETLRSEFDVRLRRFPRNDEVDDFEDYYTVQRAMEDSQYD